MDQSVYGPSDRTTTIHACTPTRFPKIFFAEMVPPPENQCIIELQHSAHTRLYFRKRFILRLVIYFTTDGVVADASPEFREMSKNNVFAFASQLPPPISFVPYIFLVHHSSRETALTGLIWQPDSCFLGCIETFRGSTCGQTPFGCLLTRISAALSLSRLSGAINRRKSPSSNVDFQEVLLT